MKLENVTDLHTSQQFCEGLVEDYQNGKIDFDWLMYQMYEYTVQQHKLAVKAFLALVDRYPDILQKPVHEILEEI